MGIDAESYRQKEALERATEKEKKRKAKKAEKAGADASKKGVEKTDCLVDLPAPG